MKAITISCVGLLWLVSACEAPTPAKNADGEVVVSFPQFRPKDLVGRGYSMKPGKLLRQCVTGTLSSSSGSFSQSSQWENHNASTVEEEVSGRGKASADFFLVSGKAKVEFLTKYSGKSTTTSFAVFNRYSAGSIGLISPRYSADLGLSPEEKEKWKEACSNRWISSVTMGSYFVWGASLLFHSDEASARLKTKFSAKALGGLVKKSKTQEEEFSSASKDATLIVWAQQVGGNEEEFRRLFTKSRSTDFELLCDEKTLKACQDAVARLESYQSGPGGFSEQMKAASAEPELHLRPLTATLTSYSRIP